jgi:hypothetical protein
MNGIHPNPFGSFAMGASIDLRLFDEPEEIGGPGPTRRRPSGGSIIAGRRPVVMLRAAATRPTVFMRDRVTAP